MTELLADPSFQILVSYLVGTVFGIFASIKISSWIVTQELTARLAEQGFVRYYYDEHNQIRIKKLNEE